MGHMVVVIFAVLNLVAYFSSEVSCLIADLTSDKSVRKLCNQNLCGWNLED